MRRLVVGVAVVLAAMAFAPAASAEEGPERGCSENYYGLVNGEGISLRCYDGPERRYQVVAHCRSGLTSWWVSGNTAYTGRRGDSTAECRGLLSNPYVIDYHVDWF